MINRIPLPTGVWVPKLLYISIISDGVFKNLWDGTSLLEGPTGREATHLRGVMRAPKMALGDSYGNAI